MATAYVVAEVTVTEPDTFRTYMRLAERSIAEAGGRYLVRGGTTEVLESDWRPPRVVVVEFDDLELARAWYRSASYVAARAARRGCATLNMIIVEGVERDGVGEPPTRS